MFEVTGALVVFNGQYLTVVNGGGLGGPDTGIEAVPLHSDGTHASGWETFAVIFADQARQRFSLQTASGHFVTAMYGGGIGGPNDATCPVHTDGTVLTPWETLTFSIDTAQEPPTMTIRTSGGNYLTAVGGGGVVDEKPNDPVQTNRMTRGGWETFSIEQPQHEESAYGERSIRMVPVIIP